MNSSGPPVTNVPVVVTGADGFVGSRLVSVLRERKFDVIALDSKPLREGTIKADITDPSIAAFVPEGSVVVHLAALASDGECRREPERAVKINVLGTLNLTTAAASKGIRQFIFASSAWVYGEMTSRVVV